MGTRRGSKPNPQKPSHVKSRSTSFSWGFGRWFFRWILALGLVLMLLLAWAGIWAHQALPLNRPLVDITLNKGDSAKQLAHTLVQSGLQTWPISLYALFVVSGKAKQLQAGAYEIEAGTSPWQLLQKLVNGRQALRTVTFPEGVTFSQMRQLLKHAPDLHPDSASLSEADLMATLGRPGIKPEGHFFPDTYVYPKHSADWVVLKQALKAMDTQLAHAWNNRQPDLPLPHPEAALILASLIEKETGHPADRPHIAAVFINRLRRQMLLQTDPSVIYGLGPQYDGHLHKKNLQTDTPFNTYTRPGLPPTPIASPGKAALWAALHPSPSSALYFVARGDGSGVSQFSQTLAEHQHAVAHYLQNRSPFAYRDPRIKP
jgi:UPF0755 protein